MSVYFARVGRYIKVGYSAAPITRSSTITTHGRRPDDVPRGTAATLIGWVPGDRDREAAFHRTYAAAFVAGEWFEVDEAEIRELIWGDPCGVDMQRMSAQAVFAMLRDPELTRAELEAAGVIVEAPPLEVSRAAFNALLTPQVPGRAPFVAAGPRGRDLTSSGSSPGR